MSVLGRYQFPKTGFKGEIAISLPNLCVAVSLTPYRVHLVNCADFTTPIAVVSAPCKIDRFILQDDPNESLVVWLVCGQDLFSAHISPVGASLPQDAASLDSKKSFNSKKRPHESASDDPTPKRGTPSQRAPPSSVSHRMAPQPRLVDATHAKRINYLSYINTSPLGTVYQTFLDSKCYFTGLKTNDWESIFLSRLETSEQITKILVCSTYDLSDESGVLAKGSAIPSSLFNAIQPGCGNKDVCFVSTSFGRIFVSPVNDDGKLPEANVKILTPLVNQSIVWTSSFAISSQLAGLILIGSGGTVVIMTEVANRLRTRKFQLSLPITSACVVNNHIVFISDGSVFSSQITCDASLVLLTQSEKQISSRLARSLVHIPGTSRVVVYCSDQVILEFDYKVKEVNRKPKKAAEMISGVLSLLEGVSEQQEIIQERERQIDDLIMHVNTGLHAGTIKTQFGIRIVPKIENGRVSLSLSLSVPPFLTSLRHWSATLSVSQSTWQWSQSIPLSEFQAQKKSLSVPSPSTLTHLIELPLLSLHPISIRSFVSFHFSDIDFATSHQDKTTSENFSASVSDPRVAIFPIGEHTFDALDLCVRTKRISSASGKNRKMPFHFRLRQVLESNRQQRQESATSSLTTMDLNFSIWSFTTWLDWKAIPESVLVNIFGNILQTGSSKASVSAIGDVKSSVFTLANGIQIPMEAITGSLISVQLRPITDSDRSSSSHGQSFPTKSVSLKSLACVISFNSPETELKQLRAALLSRVRNSILSGSPEPSSPDEISTLKTFTRGVQSSWKGITSLESSLNNLKSMRAQLQPHRDQVYSHAAASSAIGLPPSLAQALNVARALSQELDALYHQLRQLCGNKLAL
jgi:hypothetical protein